MPPSFQLFCRKNGFGKHCDATRKRVNTHYALQRHLKRKMDVETLSFEHYKSQINIMEECFGVTVLGAI